LSLLAKSRSVVQITAGFIADAWDIAARCAKDRNKFDDTGDHKYAEQAHRHGKNGGMSVGV